MLPWFLFSTVLGEASSSLVSNANLIGKVYFPRLIIPASAVVGARRFCDQSADPIRLDGVVRLSPQLAYWFLPGFIALAVLASLGPALLFTALNVKYRDFRFIIPFVVQFGLYVSPVGFSSAVVPESGASGTASTRSSAS